jgi:hypothetical protein
MRDVLCRKLTLHIVDELEIHYTLFHNLHSFWGLTGP